MIEFDGGKRVLAAGLQPLRGDQPSRCGQQTAGRSPAGCAPARSSGRTRRPVSRPSIAARLSSRLSRHTWVCARATSSHAPRSCAGRANARPPSAASTDGSISPTTLRAISFWIDEHIAQFAVVLLGPVMQPVRSFNQLRADAQSLVCAANAAAHHIAHPELAADRTDIGRAILVDEGRVARDHEQPFDARQCRDQVFGHAIGDMPGSGSSLKFSNGRTAIEGRSGNAGKRPVAACLGWPPLAAASARTPSNR